MKTFPASPRYSTSAPAFVALFITSMALQSSHAASGSWTNAVDGNWSNNASWSGASFPNGIGQSANFSGNVTGTLVTTTLDGNYTITSTAKNANSSSNWTVSGASNTLTLQASSGNSTIANNHNGVTTYTLDANLALNSDTVVSGNGNNNARVVIGATPGARTITGSGNITLNNTFSSGAGQLVINSNINTTGGIFNNSVQGVNTSLIAGVIGSTVTGVTQNGNRTLTLSGANTYTGPTTVNLGTLSAGVASVAGVSGAFGNNSAVTIANAAATLNLNGNNTQIGSLAGGGATGGTVAIGAAALTIGGSSVTTYSGNITGTTAGSLIKTGSGTQTLVGNNPFAGNITVSQGTLVAGRAGIADVNNAFAINLNGGVMDFRNDTGSDKNYTLVRVNVLNPSILSYNNTNSTSYSLQFTGANAFAVNADLTIQNNSSGNATANNQINIARAMTGAGNLTIETLNTSFNDTGDSFTPGRVQLSGNNTGFNGNVIVAKGNLQLSGNTTTNTLGNGVLTIGKTGDNASAGVAFNTSSDQIVTNNIVVATGGFRAIKNNSAGGNFTIALNGTTTLNGDLTVDHGLDAGRTLTLGGVISGGGNLTIDRRQGDSGSAAVITGNNTYTGTTTVASGATLRVSNSAGSGTGTGAVGVQSGATLGGTGTVGGATTLTSGTIGSSGATLTLNSTLGTSGTSTLAAGSTVNVAGGTTVTSGTFTINGNLGGGSAITVSSGTLEIGSTGSINSNTGLTVASGANFKYNSSTAYTGGAINNNGTISGTGTLNVAVTLDSLTDVLAPGNSPGVQAFGGAQTWDSFTYQWEINNFTGTNAGVDFDQVTIGGALDLTGGPGDYVLNILSLDQGTNLAGDAANFSESSVSWTVLTASSITGFNASNWTVNAVGFSNIELGTFSLVQNGNSLDITYTPIPEPSAFAAMAGVGVIGIVLNRRRRQQKAPVAA